MKRYFSILFCSLFLFATASPLVIMLLSEEKTISTGEKRKLTPWPDFQWDLEGIQKFPRQFEEYFDDHFGLRDNLIAFYNGIFVELFQSSPKDHAIVGSDKWLFLSTPDFVINDFLGLHLFDEARLRHWKQILLDRQEWLADQGIHYLFIPPPNKIMIYPEYLPDRILQRRGRTNLDQFVERLNTPPVFTGLLDLRKPLLDAKNTGQLYLKADTHWNFDGSYVAYLEIMARLQQWFPEMRPIPKEQMVVEEIQISGDISKMLNLASMYEETFRVLHIPDGENLVNFKDFKGYPQPATLEQHFRTGKLFTNENPTQKHTALFISDSFGTALREYLCAHFRRIIFVKDARFEDLKKLIEIEQPEVVIDINVARGLYVALGENKEITRYIMEKHGTRENILLDIDAGQLQNTVKEVVNAHLTGAGKETTIETTEQDPQLIFDLGDGMSQSTLHIQCTISSPVNTTMRLYFHREGDTRYKEKHMISAKLRKGINSIFLRLYDPIQLESLRLDPGEKPGQYRIDRLLISQESSSES